MEENNDQPVATADANAGDTETNETSAEGNDAPKNQRVTLTPEEQLAIHERKAKKLRKDLGIEEAPKAQAPDELSVKAFLRSAQITDAEEVELALTLSKKWDMPIDKLVDDEDFVAKLSKHRTQKANEIASTGIKGSPGEKSAGQTPELFIARGAPPTREEVPDRKQRATITRAFLESQKNNGKTFYNE